MFTDTLYHKGKGGALYSWRVWTDGAAIMTEHGLVTGKKQISTKLAKPKNIGKKNATTAEQQALKEAEAMFTYQIERRYSLTPEDAQEELELPMLAKHFKDRKHKVTYPGFVQPKLDGFRCLAIKRDGKITLSSREGMPFNLPHLEQALLDVMPEDTVVDGELYKHGVGFQTLCTWIKKNRPETLSLQYHIYDVPEFIGQDDESFAERAKNLSWFETKLQHTPRQAIAIVPTEEVANEDEVLEKQAKWQGLRYEGAMFRAAGGVYEWGNARSDSLLKLKEYSDAEFLVLDAVPGDGKFSNKAVFICQTEDGKIFRATPTGSDAQREEYLAHKDKYIGRQLTVKFFGNTDSGVPRHPIGLHFRPDFDLPATVMEEAVCASL